MTEGAEDEGRSTAAGTTAEEPVASVAESHEGESGGDGVDVDAISLPNAEKAAEAKAADGTGTGTDGPGEDGAPRAADAPSATATVPKETIDEGVDEDGEGFGDFEDASDLRGSDAAKATPSQSADAVADSGPEVDALSPSPVVGDAQEEEDEIVARGAPKAESAEESEFSAAMDGSADAPPASDVREDAEGMDDAAEKKEKEEEADVVDSDDKAPTNDTPPEIPLADVSPPPRPDPSSPSSAPPGPVDNAVRASSHSRLRAYEAKRRAAYTSKLSSSSLYWRSFRDLLHSSLEETERAELLVRGSAEANRAYSEAMACAASDSLDDDGKPVTDLKKRKKLKERREKLRAERRGNAIGGGVGAAAGGGGADGGVASALHAEMEDGRRGGRLRSARHESSTEKRGMILSALIESCAVLAERFAENAKFVQEDMATEIGALRGELMKEVVEVEKLGDAILDELEEAEHEVDRAWERYYATATKALGHSARGRQGASSAPEPSSAAAAADREPLADCLDVWVVEMQYRMSVAYLSTCWEKCSSELSKLFSSMKETECTRRFRLRELMIAFVQRQERLWLGLPSVLTPVLKDLVDRPMDRTSIENDVQQSIRLRAQNIQREEQSDKAHREREARDRTGPGLTGVNASEGNFELSSPLLSDLLFKAHVIEKKASGYMSAWKTTLAVVTADSFLHLFELPTAVRVQSGSAPEVAFHALVPPVEVPTQESIRHRAARKAASEWHEHLVPAESLVLPNCSIAYKDEPGNCVFEVRETVFTVGASKVFGSTTTRRMYLRTLSQEETKKWITALKAPK